MIETDIQHHLLCPNLRPLAHIMDGWKTDRSHFLKSVLGKMREVLLTERERDVSSTIPKTP